VMLALMLLCTSMMTPRPGTSCCRCRSGRTRGAFNFTGGRNVWRGALCCRLELQCSLQIHKSRLTFSHVRATVGACLCCTCCLYLDACAATHLTDDAKARSYQLLQVYHLNCSWRPQCFGVLQ
jgi:hypothetical protein